MGPGECEALAGGIPTTSQWGPITMVAALLAAGSIGAPAPGHTSP